MAERAIQTHKRIVANLTPAGQTRTHLQLTTLNSDSVNPET